MKDVQLELSFKLQFELLESIINHAKAVVGAKDLEGHYIFVNKEYSRLFHIEQKGFIGRTDHELFPNNIADSFRKADLSVIKELKTISVEENAVVDEEMRCFLSIKFPIYNNEGDIYATGLIATDITERKKMEEKIRRLALTDYVTQLSNRAGYLDRLEQAIKHAKRNKTYVGVAIIDLDNFKQVNDTFGHHTGDNVLKEVSKRLLSVFREVDTVARFGGDEFAIILDSITSTDFVHSPMERMIELLNNPILFEGNEIKIGASAGVAFYPGDSTSSEKLLRKADKAMYQAKEVGKNNVKYYDGDQ